MTGSGGPVARVETREVKLRRLSLSEPRGSHPRILIILVLLLFAVFIVTLRFLAGLGRAPVMEQASTQSGKLRFSLRTNASHYSRGEPISLEITVRNLSKQPVQLAFDTDQEFDFLVETILDLYLVQLPREVWRFQANKEPRPKPHAITLLPGKVKTWRARWDQTDRIGRPIPAGRYLIHGFVNSRGERQSMLIHSQTGG